jgi:hypothetical protein
MSLKETCKVFMHSTLGVTWYECAVVAPSVDNVALVTHANL